MRERLSLNVLMRAWLPLGGEEEKVEDRPEKVEQILTALESGTSKASVCRTFRVPRSTLIDTLRRIGWTGPGSCKLKANQPDVLS